MTIRMLVGISLSMAAAAPAQWLHYKTAGIPRTATRPWTETIRFELAADTEMLEDVCDNEKDAEHYPPH